jgi:hypothetical protein
LKRTRGVIDTVVEEFLADSNDGSDWSDLAKYMTDGGQEFRENNITFDALTTVTAAVMTAERPT